MQILVAAILLHSLLNGILSSWQKRTWQERFHAKYGNHYFYLIFIDWHPVFMAEIGLI